jgi:formylglycine-generating enzyme required for sulfatase activity
MPTQAEWEYACRAGTNTSRFYGEDEDLLAGYGWHVMNSKNRAWPLAQLKPNEFGLFDILGNGREFCQGSLTSAPFNRLTIDVENMLKAPLAEEPVSLRGGTHSTSVSDIRCSAIFLTPASTRGGMTAIRVVRTWR